MHTKDSLIFQLPQEDDMLEEIKTHRNAHQELLTKVRQQAGKAQQKAAQKMVAAHMAKNPVSQYDINDTVCVKV
jgi:hypothetical protein